MRRKELRDAVTELRWLATRLEMLGGHPGPRAEDHVAALTRAMMSRAIRVIAGVIEEIDDETLDRDRDHSVLVDRD